MSRIIAGIAGALLALATPLLCVAEGSASAPPQWEIGAGAGYFTGDYGTDAAITTVYAPVTVKKLF